MSVVDIVDRFLTNMANLAISAVRMSIIEDRKRVLQRVLGMEDIPFDHPDLYNVIDMSCVIDVSRDKMYSLISVQQIFEIFPKKRPVEWMLGKYLLMLNPSTDMYHLEDVSNDCCTVQQALNFRNTGDIKKSLKNKTNNIRGGECSEEELLISKVM